MKTTVNTFMTSRKAKINYYIFGEEERTPIFFFHGFPGTGKQAQLLKRNSRFFSEFKVIAVDRPGYGFSDFYPQMNLKNFSEIIDELSNHLGIEKFISLGVSGGAPYAAAVSYYLPHKVAKGGSISGVAPVTRENLFHLSRKQIQIYLLKKVLPDSILNFFISKLHESGIEQIDKILSSDLSAFPEKDKEVIRDPYIGPFLEETFKEAFKLGLHGLITDIDIISKPWGFPLENIQVPYYVWHGEQDQIIPPQIPESMFKSLSQTQFIKFADEGHYSVCYNYQDEILQELLK